MKKFLILFVFLLASCHNAVIPITPVVPVNPVDPNAPKHATGFKYVPGQKGLKVGVAFGLAPIQAQIPASFSWVTEGFGTPVRDQGSCGSCWAFGSTQMLDGAVKIYDNKDMTLAEQEIVAYDSESSGCAGGNFAGDFLVKNGLILDSACPYTASDRGCQGGMPTTSAAKPASWNNLGDGNTSPTTAQIQQAILQYGVIACDVAATGQWDSFSGSGLLSGNSSGINHIIAIVGWDGTKGAWIMKNSWGSSWGNAGYALVPYGNFSICTDAAFIQYKSLPAFKRIRHSVR